VFRIVKGADDSRGPHKILHSFTEVIIPNKMYLRDLYGLYSFDTQPKIFSLVPMRFFLFSYSLLVIVKVFLSNLKV